MAAAPYGPAGDSSLTRLSQREAGAESSRSLDERSRTHGWWRVAAHLLAAALVALVAQMLLFTAGFKFDGDFGGWIGPLPVFGQTDFGCAAPLDYLREPRQSEVFAEAVCWDAAHDRIRIAALLLTLMVAAWAAGSIARCREGRVVPYALAFLAFGAIAVAGDWFMQWPWWADLLNG